jgi:hypothetical protein
MTVAQLVQEYVDEIYKNAVLKTPGQVSRLHIRFKRFVSSFGDHELASLTPEQITNWLKPLGGLTHRSQLVALFRHAIQRGYLDSNPAYAVPQKAPRTAFLTTRQIP